MTEQKTNTINIEGKEYKVEDLSEEQKYLVLQIKDLRAKSANLKFQLDQVNVAQKFFSDSLIQSVKDTDNETTASATDANAA